MEMLYGINRLSNDQWQSISTTFYSGIAMALNAVRADFAAPAGTMSVNEALSKQMPVFRVYTDHDDLLRVIVEVTERLHERNVLAVYQLIGIGPNDQIGATTPERATLEVRVTSGSPTPPAR
jgi:hypothetical protein